MESKYFKESEFKCKCCGNVHINQELIDLLDKIREEVAEPVFVTSGYRCESHNRACGGKPKSQHVLGNAADIHVKSRSPKHLYSLIEEKFNPNGMGLYSTFVHVDVRPGSRARW